MRGKDLRNPRSTVVSAERPGRPRRVRPEMLWLLLVLSGVAVVLEAGCGAVGGTSHMRNHYMINYTPRSAPPAMSKRPYPYSLQVGRFDVHRATNRLNITYRYSPHQIQYYERERWAVRPDFMIRDTVFRHLEEAALTRHLALDFFDARPDFRIEGTVDALEKLDAGDLFFGRLAMSLKVIRVETGEQVWSHAFDQRRRVQSADMVKTVQTLSDIFQSQMNLVVAQLDSLFLAASTGQVLVEAADAPVVRDDLPQPEPVDTGVDESVFEIIRERR